MPEPRWTWYTRVSVDGKPNGEPFVERLHDPFMFTRIMVNLSITDRLRVLLGKPLMVTAELDADTAMVATVMNAPTEATYEPVAEVLNFCTAYHPKALPWHCACSRQAGHDGLHRCDGCGFEWVGCEMTEEYWPIIECAGPTNKDTMRGCLHDTRQFVLRRRRSIQTSDPTSAATAMVGIEQRRSSSEIQEDSEQPQGPSMSGDIRTNSEFANEQMFDADELDIIHEALATKWSSLRYGDHKLYAERIRLLGLKVRDIQRKVR